MSNHTDITEPAPNRRRISLPPRTLLGVVGGRPVYNIAGGADDDFDVESGDGDGGDDDSDGSDDSDGDGGKAEAEKPKPKPPATKPKPAAKDDDGNSDDGDDDATPTAAELKRTQAALKKANDDAKRHRLRNKELEEAARANESEQEKALREAREEGEKRFRTPLVRAAARAALAEAGLNGSTDRVLKLVDMDNLSVDDEGDVIGLDGEIDKLKQEYPEFFQAPSKTRSKARPTAADRQPAREKPKTTAQRHADKVLNRFAG